MADRRSVPHHEVQSSGGRALIGLVFDQDGRDVTRYFADDAAADAAVEGATERAVGLIGAWSDLDWDETEGTLLHIRHETPPSPLVEG